MPTQRFVVSFVKWGEPSFGPYKWSSRIGEESFAMAEASVTGWLATAKAFRGFAEDKRERMLFLLSTVLTTKCAARVAPIGRTSVGCSMHGDRNATRVWQAEVSYHCRTACTNRCSRSDGETCDHWHKVFAHGTGLPDR